MLDLKPTDALYKALAGDNVEWALLVQLGFKAPYGGTIRIATAAQDVTLPDGSIYESDDTLIGASPMRVDSEPGREPFVLTFVDPVRPGETRWIDRFAGGGYVGIPLTISLSLWFDAQWTNALVAYTGTCIQVQEGVASGGETATLAEFAGPLAKLSDAQPLILTPENARRRHATDNFLDFVHVARNLNWGKLIR